jgi:hypothetical protein
MDAEKKQIQETLRSRKQKIIRNSKTIEIGLSLKEMKHEHNQPQPESIKKD